LDILVYKNIIIVPSIPKIPTFPYRELRGYIVKLFDDPISR